MAAKVNKDFFPSLPLTPPPPPLYLSHFRALNFYVPPHKEDKNKENRECISKAKPKVRTHFASIFHIIRYILKTLIRCLLHCCVTRRNCRYLKKGKSTDGSTRRVHKGKADNHYVNCYVRLLLCALDCFSHNLKA